MDEVAAWVYAHDWQIALVATWALVNVGPRPHPETLTGPSRLFWLLVDRLSVLSAAEVPGAWKWLFVASELPAGAIVPAPATPTAPATPATPAPEAAAAPGDETKPEAIESRPAEPPSVKESA